MELRLPDSCESFPGSRTEPLFFCESRFGVGGAKIANRRFEAIRANRSHLMKIDVSLRIDLRESMRANRTDSRCELPGHLRGGKLRRGETHHKTPPPKRLWAPRTYDAFPVPPVCLRLVIFLRGTGADLTNPTF